MAITRAKATKVLSATEQRLYEATRRGRIGDHSATRLRKMLESATKQQEKQRTLVAKRRQKKGADPGEGTQLKREVFSDIVSRLEDAVRKADVRPDPERGRPRPKARKAERKQRAAPRKSAQERVDDQRALRAQKRSTRAKKTARKPTKAARRASRERRDSSVKAHNEAAPKGAERRPKGQIAADRAHIAHGAARGKRNQAKRDRRS